MAPGPNEPGNGCIGPPGRAYLCTTIGARAPGLLAPLRGKAQHQNLRFELVFPECLSICGVVQLSHVGIGCNHKNFARQFHFVASVEFFSAACFDDTV